MNNKLSFHILFLLAVLVLSSSCSLSSRIKKANRKYEMGEYFAAAPLYRKVIPKVPAKDKETRGELSYKMGNCYRLINDNTRAESAYRNAVRYKYRDEDDLYLFYAEVLRKTKKYKEARTNYLRYLEKDSTNTWASNGLISCDSARVWEKLPAQYSVKKEDAMNWRRTDFSPAVSDEDGKTVYFTSSRNNAATGKKNSAITGIRNNDIFLIKKNSKDKWEDPTPLSEEINTEFDEGACSFSPDGRTMYFTRSRTAIGETIGTEIYYSARSGGEWTTPKQIKLFADSTISVAHPCLAPSGNQLYFVSDAPGGLGEKDIWRAQKITDLEWDTPENLGSEINTPGNEMFPTFGKDGTLYFSSDGHPGLGALDIFKAKQTNENGWEIENMRAPINSENDDFGMTFIGRTNRGYFSSNRKEPKGWDKIYRFEEPLIEFVLTGKVLDNENQAVEDAVIRIVGDDGTNTKLRVKKDGSYKFNLEKGVNYVMQASARGYLNEKGELSTFNLSKTKSFQNDFHLPSAGKPVKIDNIFFDFGKHTLTSSSEEALGGLVKMLEDNPNITIEIGAHTDMVGSDELNLRLSARRAQSVVDFLIKSGIEKERLTAKGYGESKPVVIDALLAEQYDFFNEGDILNEEFVLTLTDKQKETANQINRRTEFMVVKTTYGMY